MNSKEIRIIEERIGYVFKNEDLLVQAFTRRSFTEENGGENNEVLEFIGDKALDTIIIRIMIERFGLSSNDERWVSYLKEYGSLWGKKNKEGIMTDLKRELVEKKSLSDAMDKLGLNEYLIMGKGDSLLNVNNSTSVKEDLFEAIIGAITVDSLWNYDVVENSVKLMIDLDKFFTSKNEDSINFIGLLQELTQEKYHSLPEYNFKELSGSFECSVYIDGEGCFFYGNGSKKSIAKMEAAKKAYIHLSRDEKYISELGKLVNRLTQENSTMLFNEAINNGIIDKPMVAEYSNGLDYPDQRWIFEIHDEYNSIIERVTTSSKKESKSKACYNYLLKLDERM